ncbi:MAG: serine hydrolase domain-containing protein [Pseudomonadota bacterium]
MQRVIAGLIVIAMAAAMIALGWYYRPWSPYSPASIAELDVPERYTETFQHMDEFMPARMIAADAPAPLPRAAQPLNFTYQWNGADKTLADWVEESRATSLMILRDGEIVHEAYFHGAEADTRHTSWSVGKSFVATLIGMALAEGRIESLDDLAEAYAPSYAGTDFGRTSLRHLLMMTAGMEFNEEYAEGQPSDVRPLFFNAFIMGREPDRMIAKIERNRDPGGDLHYASPTTHVLAAVARGVYEAPLADIVEDRIWRRLGMEHQASWLQHKPGENGQAIGYCCLQAATVDYARFGEFYRVGGRWNGEALVSPDWAVAVGEAQAPFQEPGPDGPYPGRGYGLHFWLAEGYEPVFAAAGVFGQWIWIDRPRGVVLVQTSGDPTWDGRREETFHVFNALAEAISPLAARREAAEAPEQEAEPDE